MAYEEPSREALGPSGSADTSTEQCDGEEERFAGRVVLVTGVSKGEKLLCQE